MAELISMLAATAGQGGVADVDPDFNQTVLLLHGDGTNGAQNNTFLDSSTNNFTITRNGNTTQGTFSPFSAPDGRWSNYFDGANLTQTALTATQTALGTGNFTVEFWVYMQQNTATQYFCDTNNGIFVTFDTTNVIVYNRVAAATAITSSVSLNVGEWYHIAVVREGTGSNQTKLYINGSADNTGTISSNLTGTGLTIGSRYAANYGGTFGYISNFRISNTARYTNAFTPSSLPFSADGNTLILTCQSNRFVDNDSTPLTLTVVGNPKVTPFSPFAPSAAYDASVNGGSGYFDGSGDYLTAASNAAFALGTGDFCIEGWYFVYTNKDYNIYFDFRNGSGTAVVPYFYSTSTGDVDYFVNGGSRITASSAIKAGQWSHIAVIRSGTDTKLFINGVQIGSTYTDSNNYVQGPVYIGRNNGGGTTYDASYYCAGFRVIKGTTGGYGTPGSTITVPTAPKVSDANTSLLCNFTNAGIFDNTGKNNLETVGNAQIDTTTKKYGTGSMEFDGTGDYLLSVSKPDLILSGDFTAECWINPVSSGSVVHAFTIGDSNTATGIQFYYSAGGSAWRVFSDNAAKIDTGSAFSGSFKHFAVVRSSGVVTVYIDGVASLSTWSTTATFSGNLYVGAQFYNGSVTATAACFIDDFRITKGVARYTTTFTPPTKAFPDL